MEHYTVIDSPIGPLLLVGGDNGLKEIRFTPEGTIPMPDPGWILDPAPFADVIQQLQDYFDGKRQTFDLKLDPQGTDFQRQVWNGLLMIPYGETISYGQLAQRIGKPSAVRAVGAANGQNPLPIIVPCHRVIGSNGTLTGYAGGLHIKKLLLDLERQSEDHQLTLL
jgi:methylated-DNA-[protein]-cysteine S-methyltransferase